MTRETLDAFIREVLIRTSETSARADNVDAEHAYGDEMRRLGWRG